MIFTQVKHFLFNNLHTILLLLGLLLIFVAIYKLLNIYFMCLALGGLLVFISLILNNSIGRR